MRISSVLLWAILVPSAVAQIGLDPQTFALTLGAQVEYSPVLIGRTVAIQAHDGPPISNATWRTVAEVPYSQSQYVYSAGCGTLTQSGMTFREAVLREPGDYTNAIYTVNEAYLAYPFLSNATVRIQEPRPESNAMTVAYAQNIYSNSVTAALPPDATAVFFRMWSPDNDPKNAIIQMCTNTLGGAWTNCAVK